MAIKLSSKDQDNIPTLTEVVTGNADSPPQAKQPDGQAKGAAGLQLPPQFERALEKLIYKKLHPQLVATSQTLAAEIMAELQKYAQAAEKTQNKPDKNQN